MMPPPHYRRIVTHTDFDGLVSALLLRDILDVDEVVFAEPWMLQQHEFDVQRGDVIVDLPYDERSALWIDHHASNREDAARAHATRDTSTVIFDETKKSCPSLIFEQFSEKHAFLKEPATRALIAAADKIDSAEFTREEIEHPDAYGRISMALKTDDKRKDDEFRMLVMNLLSFQPVEKVVEQPAVKARVAAKLEGREKWRKNALRYARQSLDGRCVLLDYTEAPEDFGDAPPLMLSVLFPDAWFTVTVDVVKTDPTRYKCSVGKNIFSAEAQASAISLGDLLRTRGGGGHKAAAGCSFPIPEKQEFLEWLLAKLAKAVDDR